MGSAKWILFILLAGTISSVLTGAAELSYLGANIDKSPMFPAFKLFAIVTKLDIGSLITFEWLDIPKTFAIIPNALLWEYSVLTHSAFGNFLRYVLLLPLSVAMIISFVLMLFGKGSG